MSTLYQFGRLFSVNDRFSCVFDPFLEFLFYPSSRSLFMHDAALSRSAGSDSATPGTTAPQAPLASAALGGRPLSHLLIHRPCDSFPAPAVSWGSPHRPAWLASLPSCLSHPVPVRSLSHPPLLMICATRLLILFS